jgi:hypothetical protein
VLVWTLAALLTALAIPSRPVLILATVLGAFWAGLEVFNPFFEGIVWAYLPLWLVTGWLAVRLESKAALNLLALGLLLWIAHLLHWHDEHVSLPDIALHAGATLVYGAVAMAGAAARDRNVPGGGILAAWAAVLTVILALALQFQLDAEARHSGANAGADYLVLAVPASLVIAGLALWRLAVRKVRPAAAAGLLAAGAAVFLLPLLAPAEGESMTLRLIAGTLFYAGAVAMIVLGSGNAGRATGTIGIAAFIGQTLYVYGETFGGLLDTALFFLVGGLILFAMSFGLLRWRRRAAAQTGQGDAS